MAASTDEGARPAEGRGDSWSQPSFEAKQTEARSPESLSRNSDEGGRAIGWIHKLTGVYSVAERHFAKGARALQKFAVPLSPAEAVHEATAQLEELAKSARGQARQEQLVVWLQQLERSETEGKACRSMVVAEPVSPACSDGDDDEWQQLSSLPATSKHISHEADSHPVEMQTNWHSSPLPGFRDLFLKSKAFQYLIEGYAADPPSSVDEVQLLLQVITTCCSDCPQSEDLMKALDDVSSAWAQCLIDGVKPDALQTIARCAADAMRGLQIKAEVEEADSKLEVLREEVAEQAATAALLHKFNHGNQQPTKDVTRKKLAQGLAATNEILLLAEALCRLAENKVKLLSSLKPPQYGQLVNQLQQRSTLLASMSSIADIEMNENLRQQQESMQFRERKTVEVDANIEAVQEEIRELQLERAALLTKLERVEMSLTKAQARKAEADEGKCIFEEGSNFTIQALSQQADQLCMQRKQSESETHALAACQVLVQQAELAQIAQAKVSKEQAVAGVLSATGEYKDAATRHLYFLRGMLQLLLQQTTFCSTELQEMNTRQTRALSLGMEHLLADVAMQKHLLMQQYLEIEAAFVQHLEDVERVYEKTRQVNERAKDFWHSEGSIQLAPEMVEVFASISKLKEAFEHLKRPDSLPPRGHKLPNLEGLLGHTGKTRGESAAARPVAAVWTSSACASSSQDLGPAPQPVEPEREAALNEAQSLDQVEAVKVESIDRTRASDVESGLATEPSHQPTPLVGYGESDDLPGSMDAED